MITAHKLHSCDEPECYTCKGGLGLCEVCGGAEAGLTKECCGRKLTEIEHGEIVAGTLDFIGGKFVLTVTFRAAEQVCEKLRALSEAMLDADIDMMLPAGAIDPVEGADFIQKQAADIERLTKERDEARHERNEERRAAVGFLERAETAEAELAAVTAERDALHKDNTTLKQRVSDFLEHGDTATLIHVSDYTVHDYEWASKEAALSTDAQVKGKHCRQCGTGRKGDTCWKCGSELSLDADGWEAPAIPAIDPIRKLARDAGYAIGVHGSMERDLDLIAAPWTDDALDAEDLLRHIAQDINAHIVSTEQKPLGRFSATLQIDGWFKSIDISVCPRVPLDAQGEKE